MTLNEAHVTLTATRFLANLRSQTSNHRTYPLILKRLLLGPLVDHQLVVEPGDAGILRLRASEGIEVCEGSGFAVQSAC